MVEVNVITLENGKDYLIVEALEVNNNRYLFLVNEDDEQDSCIRKVITENNEEYLIKLDDKEEYENVMTTFNEKIMRKEEENE